MYFLSNTCAHLYIAYKESYCHIIHGDSCQSFLLSQGAWEKSWGNRVEVVPCTPDSNERIWVTNIPPDSCLLWHLSGRGAAKTTGSSAGWTDSWWKWGGQGHFQDWFITFFKVKWKRAVVGAEALRRCHRCLQPLRSALPGAGGQQLPGWERALGGKCRSGFSSLQPTEQALSSHPSCRSENPK